MKLNLNGKNALVTGASRGIGLATVRTLRDEGVIVMGAARTITAEPERSASVAVELDLTAPGAATMLIAKVTDQYSGIDLLVNNVGGGDNLKLSGFAALNRPGLCGGSDSAKDDDHASTEEVSAGAS